MNALEKLLLIPVMAFLVGVAIMFVRIASDWTPDLTRTLVGGGLAVCGVGVGAFALVFGLVAGLAIQRRLHPPAQSSQSQILSQPPARAGYYLQDHQPPLLTDNRQGSYYTNGPASYSLWEDEELER